MLFSSWFSPKQAKQEEVYKTVVHNSMSGPTFTPNDFASFVRDGYASNELLYAALNLRANSFVEAGLVTVIDGEHIEDHPLLAVFNKPNDYMSGLDLFKGIILSLDLDGNAFLVKEMGRGKQVKALHPLRPDRVAVVASTQPGQAIKGYEYTIGSTKVFYPTEEILHFQYTNPLSLVRGMSPIEPIIRSIDIDNESKGYLKYVLENMGVPGGILKVMGNIGAEAFNRLAISWKQRTSGSNKGSVAILPEDVDYIQTGMKLTDMNISAITALTESRILLALGVNPMLIGAQSGAGASTFNNVAEAKLSFYQQTIIPLHRLIASKLTNDKELNPNGAVKFKFDSNNVAALAPLRESRINLMAEGFRDGWITINEVRTEAGKEPVEGGDELIRRPSMDIPQQGQYDTTSQDQNANTKSLNEPEEEATETRLERLNKYNESVVRAKKDSLEIVEAHISAVHKIADNGHDELMVWAGKFFEAVYNDVTKSMLDTKKALTPAQLDALLALANSQQEEWKMLIFNDETLPTQKIAGEVAEKQIANLDPVFDVDPALYLKALEDNKFAFAERISRTAADKVRKIFTEANAAGMTLSQITSVLHEEFLGDVSKNAARRIAQTETIRAANEGNVAAYQAAGVKTVKWLASGDACAYCQGLNGMVVGTNQPFVKGDTFQPEGANSPLNVSYTGGELRTPPCHPNCRCTLIAEDF